MNIAKHIDKFTADELKEMAQWLEYNPGGPYRHQYGNIGLVAFAPLDELLRIYGPNWYFMHAKKHERGRARPVTHKSDNIRQKLKKIKGTRE